MASLLASVVGAILLLAGIPTPVVVQAMPSPKVIFLTFDDGPHSNTPKVLAALAKYNAKATFFVNGVHVRDRRAMFNKIIAGKHEIANHTWNHPKLTTLSSSKVKWQLSFTQKVLGTHKGKCWRPPYGATNARVDGVAMSLGLRKVMWNIDTGDWQRPSAQTISNRVTSKARNGSIVLMHDGGDDGDRTAQALYIMLPKLKKMGYVFKILPNC